MVLVLFLFLNFFTFQTPPLHSHRYWRVSSTYESRFLVALAVGNFANWWEREMFLVPHSFGRRPWSPLSRPLIIPKGPHLITDPASFASQTLHHISLNKKGNFQNTLCGSVWRTFWDTRDVTFWSYFEILPLFRRLGQKVSMSRPRGFLTRKVE